MINEDLEFDEWRDENSNFKTRKVKMDKNKIRTLEIIGLVSFITGFTVLLHYTNWQTTLGIWAVSMGVTSATAAGVYKRNL